MANKARIEITLNTNINIIIDCSFSVNHSYTDDSIFSNNTHFILCSKYKLYYKMNILIEYYKKYFQDISEIDYLDHVHDETMESNDLIEIQERTMGISFKAIHLLYPLC